MNTAVGTEMMRNSFSNGGVERKLKHTSDMDDSDSEIIERDQKRKRKVDREPSMFSKYFVS